MKKFLIAILIMGTIVVTAPAADDVPLDIVRAVSANMQAAQGVYAAQTLSPHSPQPPNPNCQCGCVETGKCNCKDCDHPLLVPPTGPLTKGADNDLILTKLDDISKRLDSLEVKCKNCNTSAKKSASDGYSYVVISSSNCPPCTKLRNELLTNAQTDGFPDGMIYKDNPSMEAQYGNINAYPTIILLHNGAEVSRHVGYMSATELKDWINNPSVPQTKGECAARQVYAAVPQQQYFAAPSFQSFGGGACVG